MLPLILAGLLAFQTGTFDRFGTERPPAQYAHFPTRPILRIEVPINEVSQVCNPVTPSPIYYGCTKFSPDLIKAFLRNPNLSKNDRRRVRNQFSLHKDLCVIVILAEGPQVSFAWQWSVWTHEFAHCNGAFHHQDGRGWFLLNGTPIE